MAFNSQHKENYMDKLTAAIAEFLQRAIAEDFQFPCYMAAIAINGSVIVTRWAPDGTNFEPEFIAEHIEGDGLALPINVMLTDSTGQAAQMLIEKAETEPEFFWPRSLPDDSTSH